MATVGRSHTPTDRNTLTLTIRPSSDCERKFRSAPEQSDDTNRTPPEQSADTKRSAPEQCVSVGWCVTVGWWVGPSYAARSNLVSLCSARTKTSAQSQIWLKRYKLNRRLRNHSSHWSREPSSCSRLRPSSEKLSQASQEPPISYHASPRDLLVDHRALGKLAVP